RCYCWGPGGRLITGDNQGMVRVWGLTERKAVRAFKAHELATLSVQMLDENTLLTSGARSTSLHPQPGVTFRTTYEDYLKLWNLKDGTLKKRLDRIGMQPTDSPYAGLSMAYERRITEDKNSTTIWEAFVLRDLYSHAQVRSVDDRLIATNGHLLASV